MNYQRNWNVATSTDGSLKTVTLTINWNDKNNHSVRLISVVNKKEIEEKDSFFALGLREGQ